MAKSRRKPKVKQLHLDALLEGEAMQAILQSSGHDAGSFRNLLADTHERVKAAKENAAEECLE